MSPGSGIHGKDRWHHSVVAETGSTNDDLLRAAAAGSLPDRSVLRADHQTSGRGRLDRRWDAPPGSNLLASLYLADAGPRPGDMLQRVGVAIVEAIDLLATDQRATNGLSVGLKWPNDVLLDGRKVAGVLAQRSTATPGLVVGFGINVAWAPPDAARVHELVDCTPAALLVAVLAAFDGLPAESEVFATVYRARLLTLGQPVRIHLPDDITFDGVASDLEPDGRIVVISTQGERRSFDVGDVVHLRPGTE